MSLVQGEPASVWKLWEITEMPRGSKPGEGNRGGGRKKGKLNKSTIEKAALAQRIMQEAAGKPGKKLGKEVIGEFMEMFGGLAAAFQPTPAVPGHPLSATDMETWAKSHKEPLFEKYAKLAAKCASDLADFQSPKMGSVQVPAPAPERGSGPVRKKFTLSIFDGQGRPAPKQIEAQANPPASVAKH